MSTAFVTPANPAGDGQKSRFNLRFAQCVRFSGTLNSCTRFRFRARMTPIRASMVGPSRDTSSSASIASCHAGSAASFFGRAVM